MNYLLDLLNFTLIYTYKLGKHRRLGLKVLLIITFTERLMSMTNRLEQLRKLHEFLLEEFAQLQNNIKCYLDVCHNAMLVFNNMRDVNRRVSLKNFDNFIVNITSVMTLIRKFNTQMTPYCPQGFKRTISIKDLENYNMPENFGNSFTSACSDFNGRCGNLTLKEKEMKLVSNENEMMSKSTKDKDFIFCRMNLIDIYDVGTILNAKIAFVNGEKCLFYIRSGNSEQEKSIRHLEQSVNFYQYFDIPPEFKIFGLAYNNRIVRAIRTSTSLYDNEMQEKFWYCYLVDYGEIVPLQSKDCTYKLTLEQQQIPAQAIECHLKHEENLDFSMKFLKAKYLSHERVTIKITKLHKNHLEVSIMKQEHSKSLDIDQTSLNGLNKAELEELYDEPLCTSNVMKAVMGYDPQDKKRICRFYDAKVGHCFKGARCRQEHTPLQPEGWTKDVILDNSLVRKYNPDIVYEEGDLINITPTCVNEIGMFYCQINNPKEIVEPLIWREDKISKWQRLDKPPLLYQLVLCRYLDGYWYRAQIISHDDNFKIFKVFYVDYGNTGLVHIRELAKCDKSAIHLPYRATLCRLEGAIVTAVDLSEGKRQKCINLMTEMIINKDLNAKVCSHLEILTISFIDEPYASIMKLINKTVDE